MLPSSHTPLHIASRNGIKDFAELLIANGADINATNEDGRTPLHLAAAKAPKDVLKLLIAKGADVNVKDKEGRSAWALIKDREVMDVAAEIEMIRKNSGK